VKSLLLSIFLSLGIHALLMGVDTIWIEHRPHGKPHPDLITISLVALQPEGEKRGKAVENKEAPLVKKIVEQTTNMPIRQEMPTKPVAPPVKAFRPQKTIEKEAVTREEISPKKISAKREPAANPILPSAKTSPYEITDSRESVNQEELSPPKKIKPKRSLKKLTKKQSNQATAKQATPIKPLENLEAVSEADGQKPQSAAVPPQNSQFATSEPPTTGQPQYIAPGTESKSMATKGDTSAKTNLILARPLYRKNPPPKYPRRARRKGYEGHVILEVLVGKKGNVLELKVFKSSGYKILDKSAVSSVQKWLFEPGTRDGKATKMWVRVPVRFRLN
jgi:periplasmic protein TonB